MLAIVFCACDTRRISLLSTKAVCTEEENGPALRTRGGVGPAWHPVRAHAPAEIQHPDQQLLHLAGREHVVGAGWEQVLTGFLGCLELGATDLELLEAELRDGSAGGRVWEPQDPVRAHAMREAERRRGGRRPPRTKSRAGNCG